jgi:hypothetical protein
VTLRPAATQADIGRGTDASEADTAESLADDAVASPLLAEDLAVEHLEEPEHRPEVRDSQPHGSTRKS